MNQSTIITMGLSSCAYVCTKQLAKTLFSFWRHTSFHVKQKKTAMSPKCPLCMDFKP